MWLDIDEANPTFANLYASHKEFVNMAVEQMHFRSDEHPDDEP